MYTTFGNDKEKKDSLWGIAIFGSAMTCKNGLPTILIRPSHFKDWIDKIQKGNN
jgi:hypothetical protein